MFLRDLFLFLGDGQLFKHPILALIIRQGNGYLTKGKLEAEVGKRGWKMRLKIMTYFVKFLTTCKQIKFL